MSLLLVSNAERAAVWQTQFAAEGLDLIHGEDQVKDPAEITHIACWVPPKDLTIYPNLRVLIGVGAGVDQMPLLPEGVSLCRTLASGIEEAVRDWVVMAALMLHRDLPIYAQQSSQGIWQAQQIVAPKNRRVGIMGMGRIGKLAAAQLSSMGFPVAGWSRSGTAVDGVTMFGADGFDAFLAQADIVVCLLPLTEQTQGLMSDAFFEKLPKGAKLVQAGRGAQLDQDALLRALDSGQLSSAMLDVTAPEPLPQDHWMWRDPRVVITPHVAAETDHAEGAAHAVAVIRADALGQDLPGLVDQRKGY